MLGWVIVCEVNPRDTGLSWPKAGCSKPQQGVFFSEGKNSFSFGFPFPTSSLFSFEQQKIKIPHSNILYFSPFLLKLLFLLYYVF